MKLGLPKPYTARVRNALSASAESVNLRNLGGGGGAFYAGGSRLESLYVELRTPWLPILFPPLVRLPADWIYWIRCVA